jgi:hypothetical protein
VPSPVSLIAWLVASFMVSRIVTLIVSSPDFSPNTRLAEVYLDNTKSRGTAL